MTEIQSLARGLAILDYLIEANRGVSITELANTLDMDKSTVSRLVKTMVSRDYIQPEAGTRRYVIGRRLYRTSWQLLNKMPVREKARPYLYRLMRQTGECSHTAVYSEGKVLVIDDVEAEASLRVVGQTGRLIPLHCTALGKILLAFGEYMFPETLTAFTGYTITDPERLRAHLVEVCRNGYALDDEEYDPGIRCMAAPVYDSMGMMIAAIGISGPTVRVTREQIEPLSQLVKQAAAELSIELGYRGGNPTSQNGKKRA
jgi:DNA-binding IclR family transcriptional regulator